MSIYNVLDNSVFGQEPSLHSPLPTPPPNFVGQVVKNLPAMQETEEMQIQFLGWEDPLKKEMATHSSILAWRIPWTEEPGRLQSIGSPKVGCN